MMNGTFSNPYARRGGRRLVNYVVKYERHLTLQAISFHTLTEMRVPESVSDLDFFVSH